MILFLLVLVLLIPILSIVLDSQVGQALAARLERRSLGQPDNATEERIGFLENETERLSTELNRLSEESQFLHKLLAERAESQVLPPGDSKD